MLDPMTLVQISNHLPKQSKLIFHSICKLYYSNNQKWEYMPNCAGCTVVCEEEKVFVLKMINLTTYNTVWQHELYEGVSIQKLDDTFVCFESDTCFIGMSFANECKSQLEMFKTVVETVVKPTKTETKKPQPTKETSQVENNPKGGGGVKGFFAKLFGKKSTNDLQSATSPVDKPQEPQLVIGAAKKDTFKHVSHVGFDGAGFSMENIPPEWQQMIGGNEELLKDEKVQKALTKTVKNFLKERNLDTVIKEENLLDLSTPTTTTAPPILPQLPSKPSVERKIPPAPPKQDGSNTTISTPPSIGSIPAPPPNLGSIPAPPNLGSIPTPPNLSNIPLPPSPQNDSTIPTPPPNLGSIPIPPPIGSIPTPPPNLGSIPTPPPPFSSLPINDIPKAPVQQDSGKPKASFLADIVNLDKSKVLKPPAPPKPQEVKKVLDINSLSQKDQVDLMTAIQFSIKNMKSKMSGDAEEEEEEDDNNDDW